MNRIECRFCVTREHTEFTYGGDATKQRPALNEESNQIWTDYVFTRDNPKGAHQEYWQHTQGCRSWVKVSRNTLTHVISETSLAKQPSILTGGENK